MMRNKGNQLFLNSVCSTRCMQRGIAFMYILFQVCFLPTACCFSFFINEKNTAKIYVDLICFAGCPGRRYCGNTF